MINEHNMITSVILLLILVVYIASYQNYKIIEICRHYPYEEQRNKSFYRWITCGFVHGSIMHLLLNMFVLYQFGFVVEQIYGQKFGLPLGSILYLISYLLILTLTCAPSYYKHKNNTSYASIGASGAISGLLFIFIYFYPMQTLALYFIPMPAFVLGILYLGYSYWAAKNTSDGIDHDAHFYGAVLGIIFAVVFDKL